MSAAEDLDHTPLTFGKYRGQTPDQVSGIDPAYIVWMYENVTNLPTCSKLLYEDCKCGLEDDPNAYGPDFGYLN